MPLLRSGSLLFPFLLFFSWKTVYSWTFDSSQHTGRQECGGGGSGGGLDGDVSAE